MNKRSKELHHMASTAGLTVVSHGLGAKGRPTIRVRAEDGAEEVFSIGQREGDLHGDKNEHARMKRFAKEHTPAPAAPAPAVASVKAPPPKFTRAGTFIPAPAVARASAAPCPTPSRTPIAPPAPVQASLTLVQPESLTHVNTATPAANDKHDRKQNKLVFAQQLALHNWITSNDMTAYDAVEVIVADAQKAVGFPLTEANVRTHLKEAGITLFTRKERAPAAADDEFKAAIAEELLAMIVRYGDQPSPRFAALCRSLGVSVPAVQKAA